MPNSHSFKTRTWRADEDEVKAAQEYMPRGRNFTAFIRACIRALGTNPEPLLAAIADHWATPNAGGRPRKTPPSGE